MKQYISGMMRKFGLLNFFDNLLFNVQRISYSSTNKKFMAAHPAVAFPPDYFVYETYRLKLDEYYNDGLNTACELVNLISKYKNAATHNFSILDWGCGPGRITRHFPANLPANAKVSGTDYNTKYIDWCKANLKGINWSTNSIAPPMGFENSSFDVITGLSVLTHLSGPNHIKWIDELRRVLKRDGITILTTQGNAFYGKLIPEEKKNFDAGRLVSRETVLEGHRLFSSFQPENYMLELIAGKFNLLELIKAKAPYSQDIWVLQKL